MVFEARKRFNHVFGGRTVCDLKARYSAIWAVCWLGVLNKKIRNAESIDEAKEHIRNFKRTYEKLNRFYNNFEMKGESDDKAIQVRQEAKWLDFLRLWNFGKNQWVPETWIDRLVSLKSWWPVTTTNQEKKKGNWIMKDVFNIVESSDGKKHWLKVGVGFVNRDGSINVKLNTLPINGILNIRDKKNKENKEG